MKTISIKRMTSILLDHWKDEYLISLKILESRDMLEERAVVIADNIIKPGVPQEYLDWVRGDGGGNGGNNWQSSKTVKTGMEHLNVLQDAMEISIFVKNWVEEL